MEITAQLVQDIHNAYNQFKAENNEQEPVTAILYGYSRADEKHELDTDIEICIGNYENFELDDTKYYYFVSNVQELIELVQNSNSDEDEDYLFTSFVSFE